MTPPEASAFHTTRWTRVCAAKSDSDEGRSALAELCEAYYEPVVAYLRGVLRDADAAREMSHSFFAEILAGGAISGADPLRGRFRFYLLGAVRHFVASKWESDQRLRRGGGIAPLSLDAETPELPQTDRDSPEAAFDRQWAVTVLARAMSVLERECATDGKTALLEHLKPSLLGEATYGDQNAAAEKLGLSAGAARVAVHRLRSRFRHCVKEEIASTLKDAASIEDEMQSLLAALGG